MGSVCHSHILVLKKPHWCQVSWGSFSVAGKECRELRAFAGIGKQGLMQTHLTIPLQLAWCLVVYKPTFDQVCIWIFVALPCIKRAHVGNVTKCDLWRPSWTLVQTLQKGNTMKIGRMCYSLCTANLCCLVWWDAEILLPKMLSACVCAFSYFFFCLCCTVWPLPMPLVKQIQIAIYLDIIFYLLLRTSH